MKITNVDLSRTQSQNTSDGDVNRPEINPISHPNENITNDVPVNRMLQRLFQKGAPQNDVRV